MEPKNKLRIITIIAFSTLITIVNPVESECVPRNSSYLAKSLTPLFPPSNPPTQEESPAPSPNPPSSKKSPEPSPNPPAAEEFPAPSSKPPADKESPAPSPNSPSPQKSPAPSPNSPAQKAAPGPFSDLPSQGESTDVKSICSQTDFPLLCESAVTPLVTGKKPDSVSMLLLAIQAATEQTKTVMEKLSASPDSETSLQDCKDVYDDALSNLQQAADAVKSRDMGTVNTMLSAALTDYSTCDDGFVETGEHNPVADLGDKLMKMASNCLAIASLIK